MRGEHKGGAVGEVGGHDACQGRHQVAHRAVVNVHGRWTRLGRGRLRAGNTRSSYMHQWNHAKSAEGVKLKSLTMIINWLGQEQ